MVVHFEDALFTDLAMMGSIRLVALTELAIARPTLHSLLRLEFHTIQNHQEFDHLLPSSLFRHPLNHLVVPTLLTAEVARLLMADSRRGEHFVVRLVRLKEIQRVFEESIYLTIIHLFSLRIIVKFIIIMYLG